VAKYQNLHFNMVKGIGQKIELPGLRKTTQAANQYLIYRYKVFLLRMGVARQATLFFSRQNWLIRRYFNLVARLRIRIRALTTKSCA